MKRILLLAAAVLVSPVGVAVVQAQGTNSPAPRIQREGHRYLVVVETSKAMGKRRDGISQSIMGVLTSALKGQVKRGDTLGLWMYNEELITGKLPLQSWNTHSQASVATQLTEFVHKQPYENEGLPEKVIPTLIRLITNSPLLTVVMITSGNADVHGTRFDEQINNVYKQWRKDQQQKKMPFVTVLRARKGEVIECSVSPAPWSAELPPLPPEPVAEIKPAPVTNAPAKVVATRPPLIVSGKKTPPETSAPTTPVQPQPSMPILGITNTSLPAAAAAHSPTSAAVIPNAGSVAATISNTVLTAASNVIPSQTVASVLPSSPKANDVVAAEPNPTRSQANSTSNMIAAVAPAPPAAALAPTVAPETAASLPARPVAHSSGAGMGWVFVAAAACVGLAALVAVYLQLRRYRHCHIEQVSLITRSLDRTAR